MPPDSRCMPAAKDLASHVIQESFRARRHHHLLAGPVVEWPELAVLQSKYAAATSEAERRAVGVAFERASRDLHAAGELRDDEFIAELDAILTAPPVLVSSKG